MPSKLSEYTGGYFRVYVLVHVLRRESSKRLTLTTGGNQCFCVRVRQLSRYSQVLLLPLGDPPDPGMLRTETAAEFGECSPALVWKM